MMKEDILFIKEQIERSIEYLKSRGTQVTVGEALQELGNLKLIVKNIFEKHEKSKIS
jgi:hypothetical protein